MSSLTPQAILALTVVALWVKGVILSLTQVGIRVRSRRYGQAEDARMMGYEPKAEDERIERIARAWRNELEATPPFLALAVAFVLSGGPAYPLWTVCLCFVVGRYAQSWAQFTLKQPLRTIAFLIGLAASMSMAALLVLHIFGQCL